MFPKDLSLENLNKMGQDTLVSNLGIVLTDFGPDFLEGRMPVDARTKQPMGLLHGGASVAMAETLGSIASTLVIDMEKQAPVGLEINANHIKSVREGHVLGRVSPIHVGKRTHVWHIEIRTESNELVSLARLTTSIIEKRKP